jgi:hypothetical protein
MVSLVGVIDKNILNKHIMISQTTVANPRKEVTVNYSKQQVLDAIDNLTSNEYFKSFENFDEVLNTFTYRFEKPISGLFKLFMRAEIEVTEISETKTKITIEISDWDNVLDDEYDVSSANILMKSILKTISQTLNPNQEVSTNETNNDSASVSIAALEIIGGIIAVVIIVSMFFA